MLSPIFNVVDPAEDLTLLTIAEMRTAVGLNDGSRDADLKRIAGRVADVLTSACNIVADGATPATLRLESVTDTFRLNRRWGFRDYRSERYDTLYLSRRPIVTVTSVVEAGVTLDPSSYEIRAAAGALVRLNNDMPSWWARDKIVISYDAGWDTVPDGLKSANEKLLRLFWSEGRRDPAVRQDSIPGVRDVTYWIGGVSDPSIPQDVMDDLGDYINPAY